MRLIDRLSSFACLLLVASAPAARAEDIPLLPGEDDSPITDRPRSWEMPAVRGRGGPAPTLREEELIGPAAQPRWTATRRFPTTRAYVVPEGKAEVEFWVRATVENDRVKYRFLQEFEVGLPYRFQFDVYLRQELVDLDPDTASRAAQVELRWALADWGKLFANPTLYFEYLMKDGAPDAIEPKLLFAGELAQGWHGALNFTLEHEVSGELEREFGVRGGLSCTLIDSHVGLGAEAVINAVDVAGARGDFEWEAFLGPSLQWKPVDVLTLNLVPLFGLVTGGPLAQIYVNIGVEI